MMLEMDKNCLIKLICVSGQLEQQKHKSFPFVVDLLGSVDALCSTIHLLAN